jgi:hypothetical protein
MIHDDDDESASPHSSRFPTQTLSITREVPRQCAKKRVYWIADPRSRRLSRGTLFVARKCRGFIIIQSNPMI